MIYPEFNRTKIIATLGPASQEESILTQIVGAGVDVLRLNFSHGDHEQHRNNIELIQKINRDNELQLATLCDLQGPKLRVGEMPQDGLDLRQGEEFTFVSDPSLSGDGRYYIDYSTFAQDVRPGERIMMDDGKLEVEVIHTDRVHTVQTRVIYGGRLKSRKGVNLPDTQISLPSLTEKDLRDLDFILEQEVEWVALSFVRSAEDIIDLKQRILRAGKQTRVIAKIEKPEALKHIKSIIAASDAVMVARGDLGVEVPFEELPLVQKNIVKECLNHSTPVIIATQMMESMIENPRPTRAESNDIANAVLDGADAVMLSGETSVGRYPVEAVRQMDTIIRRVERDESVYHYPFKVNRGSATYISDAVCASAVHLSEQVNAKALVGMTKSGFTAVKLSCFRPRAPIFIFTNNQPILKTLSLVWGVRAFYYDKFESTDQTFNDVNQILKQYGHVRTSDVVVNTASMPILKRARTNALKVSVV